jgi:hypothetical protein
MLTFDQVKNNRNYVDENRKKSITNHVNNLNRFCSLLKTDNPNNENLVYRKKRLQEIVNDLMFDKGFINYIIQDIPGYWSLENHEHFEAFNSSISSLWDKVQDMDQIHTVEDLYHTINVYVSSISAEYRLIEQWCLLRCTSISIEQMKSMIPMFYDKYDVNAKEESPLYQHLFDNISFGNHSPKIAFYNVSDFHHDVEPFLNHSKTLINLRKQIELYIQSEVIGESIVPDSDTTLEESDYNIKTVISMPTKNMRISQKVFDAAVVLPDSVTFGYKDRNSLIFNTDDSFYEYKQRIKPIIYSLDFGGVFICFLPIFRIWQYKDVFMDALKDIHIYYVPLQKLSDDEFYTDTEIRRTYPLCVLYGQRKRYSEKISDKDFKLFQSVPGYIETKGFALPDITGLREPRHVAEHKIKEHINFSGLEVTTEDILNHLNDFHLTNEIIDNQKHDSLSNDKQPLLPFTSGQLGLVLVSGQLNGVITEENGCGHLLKGISIKSSRVLPNTETNSSATITSNAVSIKIIRPDGRFIELK